MNQPAVFGIPAYGTASWSRIQATQRVAACRANYRRGLEAALREGGYARYAANRARLWRHIQLIEGYDCLASDNRDRWHHLLRVHGLGPRRPRAADPPPRPRAFAAAAPLPLALEGVALVFGSRGRPRGAETDRVYVGSSICVGAFDESIKGGRVALAVGHDLGELLGHQPDTLRLWTSDFGQHLHFRCRLFDSPVTRRFLAKAEHTGFSGVSIGYHVDKASRAGDRETIVQGRLNEISICFADESRPAFSGTIVRLMHVPPNVSIHDPRFLSFAGSSAVGVARKQLKSCGR